MKISYNWLKNYIDLDPVEHSPEVLAEVLPLLGFDIESLERLGPPPLENVVVGEVLEFAQHPNADRLRVCKVSTGQANEVHTIVCGAKNFQQGDRVMVALPGAVLPGDFKIKKSKLRGEPSEGMLCSARELNIGSDHAGILILDASLALGTPINSIFTEGDTVLEVEVTPNRVDALCHLGIARELAARFGCSLRYPEVQASAENPSEGAALISSVEVSAPEICPHYTATCIKGVRVGPSPKWLRAAIEAIGLRPINNVVDVTNYVLHETCQPLHAFDAAKIRGGKLVVRRAQAGEVITTLDEKKRALSPDMAVIADAERPLVVAGVMGSLDAEVEASTTDIVLESAYFDASLVRSTARQLGLSTDSSYRFERGVDPRGVEYAAMRAVDLILEVAGGRVDGNRIVAGNLLETVNEVTLRPEAVRAFIGFDVSDAEIQAALEALELDVSIHDEPNGAVRWEVAVPSFRGDLQRPVDLIEEFVRIYGTDKIPETRVVARGISENDDRIHRFNGAVASYLCGQNFDEAYLYSLRDSKETLALFGQENLDLLCLANPLQSDQSHLRPSLIPGLLDVLQLNQARGTEGTRFFERGHVFRALGGAVVELISVGFVMLAESGRREWLQRNPADFYTARTLCENVLELAGVPLPKVSFRPIEACALWQPLHAATAGDFNKVGYECCAGLLNVETLKERWDMEHSVIAGSVLLTPKFFERRFGRSRHAGVSVFPASGKDLAFIVDHSVLADAVVGEVAKAAKKACQGFDCESVRIFDRYEGSGLPEGKKSLALNMRFRAPDRTLTDKEVNAAFEQIQKIVAERTSFQIRK